MQFEAGRLVATRRLPQHAGKPPTGKSFAVDRAAKAESITELSGVFKTSNVVVVAHYAGLTVAQMQTLRMQMKQAGGHVKVAKNRLAKIALKDTDVASIASLLKGPTVLAYSGDPVAAPKVAVDFAKANEAFVILGGSMGKTASSCRRRPRSHSSPTLPRPRSRALSRLMHPRVLRPDGSKQTQTTGSNLTGTEQWLTCRRSLMNFRP